MGRDVGVRRGGGGGGGHALTGMRAPGAWTSTALTVLALAACGDTPAEPVVDPGPQPVTSFDFLAGSWSVASRDTDAGGGVTQGQATAVVRSSLTGRARKEAWVGTRNGADVEMATLIIAGEQPGEWILARGDGGAGTFDVLEGRFTSGQITLVSRSGTRPDGGLNRETFESITDSSFVRRAERSGDGGGSWTEFWKAEYRRIPSVGAPAGPTLAAGCQASEHRQFDFWEGAWAVGGSTNDLISLLGGCILEENWSSASERGTSFNMYDARSGLWNQVWVDTNDLTLVTVGGLVDTRMVLAGRYRGTSQRITWTPLNGNVRQHGENSVNGGASWTTSYDLTYTRR